jgi:hypothetical protein
MSKHLPGLPWVLVAVLAGIVGAVPSRAEQLALYLRAADVPAPLPSGDPAEVLLSPEVPPAEEQLSVTVSVSKNDSGQFGEFISTAPHIDRIALGPLSAVLYLSTHRPTEACANLGVDLFRKNQTSRQKVATGAAEHVTIGPHGRARRRSSCRSASSARGTSRPATSSRS